MRPLPPLPPPQDRSRLSDAIGRIRLRVLVLWLALAAAFVAMQLAFGGAPAQDGAARHLLPVLLPFAVLLAMVLWPRLLSRRLRRAVEASRLGDEAGARAGFLALDRPWCGQFRQAAWVNLGLLDFHGGEVAAGLGWFGRLEASRGNLPASYGQLAADHLALGLALRGDPAASGWLEQARRRPTPPSVGLSRLHRLAEAVLASRRGDAAGAHRLAEAAWPEVERSVTAAQARSLLVLRAFLAAAAGAATQALLFG